MSSGRVRRVADRIRVIVAEMLERRIKDVRLGFVTITDVRVTGDTQHASIFYTVLGDEEQRAASGAALQSAKGLIRSEVGKQLGMRHTPTLEFILDALPESAAHIEELLERARDSDAAVAAAAADAAYAGDVDPYKHPPLDDDLDAEATSPAAAPSLVDARTVDDDQAHVEVSEPADLGSDGRA
ncbi:MAG: 30S ribosome-binding factor RbfA [Propionibacteriales bacterium]|nr:30S ribosome-binding factor RbfA [Propionibacteriales bacterium]